MRYKILLNVKVDEKTLKDIKNRHSKDVEGIDELYDQLITNGTCDSEKVSRIYYVAYTLALSDIEIIIVRMN